MEFDKWNVEMACENGMWKMKCGQKCGKGSGVISCFLVPTTITDLLGLVVSCPEDASNNGVGIGGGGAGDSGVDI